MPLALVIIQDRTVLTKAGLFTFEEIGLFHFSKKHEVTMVLTHDGYDVVFEY